MTKQKLAEKMLQAFTGGLFETDNDGRHLTAEELYALNVAYSIAKPYLTETYDRQWCEGVMSRVDFNNRDPGYEEDIGQLIGLVMGYIKTEK